MTGIIGAIIGATGFGIANVVIKKSLSTLTIPQTLMMSTLSGVVFLALFSFLRGIALVPSLSDIYLSAAFACAEVVLYLVLYKTFAVSNVTVATAVSGIYPLLSILLTVFVFSEKLAWSKFGFISLLVVGAIITSIDWGDVARHGFRKKDLVKGFGWIILTTLSHALYYPLLGNFTSTGDWESKLLWIKIFSAVILFSVFFLYKRVRIFPPQNKIVFTSLLGLLEVTGWAGFSWATNSTEGQTAVMIGAMNSAALVTAVFAYFFLKEKLSKIQYIGICMIIVGMTGLSH